MISSRDILGFSVAQNMGRVMEINGYYASIMRAEKKEKDHDGLPLGMPIPVMAVDYLKNKPNFWVGGPGSYVCPVESDWALWFNWTMNNRNISILTSVKGMNPITGARINDQKLEQYKNKCPIHDIEFKHGKFCTECNFKWPDQNYITDPDPFYLDGFRTADGSVRQFYFTEDMAKSIPELVIGKEDTVPAFGFCFYTLKNTPKIEYENGNRIKNVFPKNMISSRGSLRMDSFSLPPARSDVLYRKSYDTGVRGFSGPSGTKGLSGSFGSLKSYRSKGIGGARGMSIGDFSECSESDVSKSATKSASINFFNADLSSDTTDTLLCDTGSSVPFDSEAPVACAACAAEPITIGAKVEEKVRRIRTSNDVGIGAGNKIRQTFTQDKRHIDEWSDKPSGIVRIYFVFREEFERYVQDGLNNLTGSREGYMSELPVGGKK